MPLHAEFNFKPCLATQRLKLERLQELFALAISVCVFYLLGDAVYASVLVSILLLLLLRARQRIGVSAVVEKLVLQNKSARAVISGHHHALATCGLNYCSSYLTLLRLTTMAGQTHHCFVTPGLLGVVKYRQLIALLHARSGKSFEPTLASS